MSNLQPKDISRELKNLGIDSNTVAPEGTTLRSGVTLVTPETKSIAADFPPKLKVETKSVFGPTNKFDKNLIKPTNLLTKLNDISEIEENNQNSMADFVLADFNRLIPEFKGDTESLNVFIRRCDTFHNNLTEAGQEKFVSNLIFKLGGKAFLIYESKTYNLWADLKADLLKGIKVSKSSSALQNELMNFRQPYDKSAKEFADSIKAKLKELSDVTKADYNVPEVLKSFQSEHEKIAIRTFREGLRSPLKERIINFEASKLDDLVKKAMEEEPFVKVFKPSTETFESQRGQIQSFYSGNRQSRNNSPPPLRALNQWNDQNHNFSRDNRSQFPRQMKRNDGSQRTNNMVCSHCNKQGHLKENCFQLANENRNNHENTRRVNFLEPPKNWQRPVQSSNPP